VRRDRVDAALRAQVLEAVAHELGEALALQNNQLRRVRGAPRREVAQRGVLRGDGRAALAVEPLETARARARLPARPQHVVVLGGGAARERVEGPPNVEAARALRAATEPQ